MRAAPIILGVLPVVFAMPFDNDNALSQRDCLYDTCPMDDNTDKKQYCHHDPVQFDAGNNAANVWFQVGAGPWLDSWFHYDHKEKSWQFQEKSSTKNWLHLLNERQGTKKAVDSEWNCGEMQGDCPPPGECESYWPTGYLYYVNKAAYSVNSAFNYMHEKLQDWAIETGFSVQQIVDDFTDEEPTTTDPFAIMASSFGIASALTGGAAQVSATFGVLSGVFSLAADNMPTAEEKDFAGYLQQWTAAFFARADDHLNQTLHALFDDNTYHIMKLPGQTETQLVQSPIARFFADGKWLIHSNDAVFSAAVDLGNIMMRNALAVHLLAAQGYWVMIDTGMVEEHCHGGSRAWIDEKCWYVVKNFDNKACTGSYSQYCYWNMELIDEDKWDLLIDEDGDYQLDWNEFYANAYQCQKKNPDGKGKPVASKDPFDTSYPECFYKIETKKGSWNKQEGMHEQEL